MLSRSSIALLPRAPYEAEYITVRSTIGFAFESQRGEHALGSDRRCSFLRKPRTLSFIPPGCDVYSASADGGEYLIITVDGWSPEPSRLVNNVFSPAAAAAAECIRRAVLAGAANFDRPLSTLVNAVCQACDSADAAGRAAHWMTARRFATLDALIEESLHETLRVDKLAARLDLSVGFFTRALRAAIGQTPHAYVMDRRISRARGLLRDGEPIASVAVRCGFSSQAHMTTAFGRRLGTSPGALRRRFAGMGNAPSGGSS
jgi:AraC family transcriptional regulator